MPSTTPVITVSDAELDELRARLRATRRPRPWPVPGWAASAFAAGRVKPAQACSGVRDASGGTSQKTASAPSKARSTTAASPCEPVTTSTRPRAASGSRAGSRTITRSFSPEPRSRVSR
nr:hypothetical protein [Nonomuraea sp. FMUSA5-5]